MTSLCRKSHRYETGAYLADRICDAVFCKEGPRTAFPDRSQYSRQDRGGSRDPFDRSGGGDRPRTRIFDRGLDSSRPGGHCDRSRSALPRVARKAFLLQELSTADSGRRAQLSVRSDTRGFQGRIKPPLLSLHSPAVSSAAGWDPYTKNGPDGSEGGRPQARLQAGVERLRRPIHRGPVPRGGSVGISCLGKLFSTPPQGLLFRTDHRTPVVSPGAGPRRGSVPLGGPARLPPPEETAEKFPDPCRTLSRGRLRSALGMRHRSQRTARIADPGRVRGPFRPPV